MLASVPMGQAGHHRFTFGECVSIEEASSIKHEFVDGGARAMSGGTPEHAGLEKSCEWCRAASSSPSTRLAATRWPPP
jgi:hypothetical protein